MKKLHDLYDFQYNALKTIKEYIETDKERCIPIDAITAAGKTTIGRALGKYLLHDKSKFRVFIVACPFNCISQNFINFHPITYKNKLNLKFNQTDIIQLKPQDGSSVKRLESIVRSKNSKNIIVIVSHSTLARFKVKNSDSFKHVCLFADESHRFNDEIDSKTKKDISNKGAQVIKEMHNKGLTLIHASATPWREEDGTITTLFPSLKHSASITRTLYQQQRDGYCAKTVGTEFEKVLGITAKEEWEWNSEHGSKSTKFKGIHVKKYIKAMYDKWLQLGKPKLIIRVPNIGFGKNVIKSLRKFNIRVLDGLGQGVDENIDSENKKRFEVALEKDRINNYNTFDILVVCRRGDLGMDVPFTSHIFCIGYILNINTVIQIIGRTLRNKRIYNKTTGKLIPYPWPQYIDESSIVFFVPENIENLGSAAQHQILRVGAALQQRNIFMEALQNKSDFKIIKKKLTPGQINKLERDVEKAFDAHPVAKAKLLSNIEIWDKQHKTISEMSTLAKESLKEYVDKGLISHDAIDIAISTRKQGTEWFKAVMKALEATPTFEKDPDKKKTKKIKNYKINIPVMHMEIQAVITKFGNEHLDISSDDRIYKASSAMGDIFEMALRELEQIGVDHGGWDFLLDKV